MELTALFCHANRLRLFGQKGDVRWCSLQLTSFVAWRAADFPRLQPAWNSPLRSVERLTCGSPDRKATFAYAHSNSLRSLLSVLPCESPDGSSGKKATFAALTPTHFVRCCPFCHANRLTALRENRHGLRFCGSRMGLSVVRKPTGVDPLVGSVAEWESIVKPQKRYVHNG